jgi:hypothetical protein
VDRPIPGGKESLLKGRVGIFIHVNDDSLLRPNIGTQREWQIKAQPGQPITEAIHEEAEAKNGGKPGANGPCHPVLYPFGSEAHIVSGCFNSWFVER